MLLNKSAAVALSGVVTALVIVLMMCTGLMPMATYALPGLAGVLLIFVVVEMNKQWAFLVYAVSGLLSLLIVPDREAVMLFILFFGYYPVLKAVFESIRKRWISWLLKLLVFNVAMIVGFFVSIYVLMLPMEEFMIGQMFLPGLLLLMGNAVFLLYDYAVSGVVLLYFQRFHGLFSKWLHR